MQTFAQPLQHATTTTTAGHRIRSVSIIGGFLDGTQFEFVDGQPAEIVACIRRGIRPDQAEIEESRKSIEPGESIVLLKLETSDPHGELGGTIGNNFLTWKIGPSRYDLSFKYWISLEDVELFALKPCTPGSSTAMSLNWLFAIKSPADAVRVIHFAIEVFAHAS